MARRNGGNNFLNIMRSMLSFLDSRSESVEIDVNISPGGAFMSRLRSRLADLINGRAEPDSDRGGRENTVGEANASGEGSSRGFRRRSRKEQQDTRRESPTIEERNMMDRCNRVMNGEEVGSIRRRRGVRSVFRSDVGGVMSHEPVNAGDPVVLMTSVVVNGNGTVVPPSADGQNEERTRENSESENPNGESAGGRRTFRMVFPRIPSQGLRFLFLTPNGERGRGSIIYEIQINFDVLDASPDAPVTATKESLNKSSVARAGRSDELCECTICMANFSRNQKLRILPCDHKFHIGCIDKWLLGHSNKCPVCRTAM